MAAGADRRHLPRAAAIDAYGNGGFRFAGMSHRGSLLCLPDGIWAWPVNSIAELTEASLAPVFERAPDGRYFNCAAVLGLEHLPHAALANPVGDNVGTQVEFAASFLQLVGLI